MRIDFWNSAWFEKWLPSATALICAVYCIQYKKQITWLFIPGKWDPSNLYSAIFNWSSIQSGFIFAVYGFVVTKRDGFVGKILSGLSFDRFLSFAKRSCFGGFALTIASLPLLVANPSITYVNEPIYTIQVLWFSLFVWAFFSFLRVAFTFGVIVGTPDRKERIAG